MVDGFGNAIFRRGDLHILGDVDDHRAGAAVGGDVESLMHHRSEAGGVHHQIIMLGAVAGDADGVAFLKGIGADQRGRHLSGDDHHRDRIHQRVGDAGDRIGRTGAGCDEDDAGLAGGARIALRRVGCRLFVADEDVLDRGMLEQCVIDRQHRAAGIAEHRIDTQIDQRLHDDVRAGHFARSGRVGGGGGEGGGHRLILGCAVRRAKAP